MQHETAVTQKFQATIPRDVRGVLGIRPGQRVRWHIARGLVIVEGKQKIHAPVRFLTTQLKRPLKTNAVKLIKSVRRAFA